MLAFPGVFRGALDVRASDINDEMKVAAAYAIANLIDEKDLTPDYIIQLRLIRVLPRRLPLRWQTLRARAAWLASSLCNKRDLSFGQVPFLAPLVQSANSARQIFRNFTNIRRAFCTDFTNFAKRLFKSIFIVYNF